MPVWIEPLFDLLYLIAGLIIAGFLFAGDAGYIGQLYGAMALVLVLGDSFHLIPRILCAAGKSAKVETAKGIGLCITSITITVFYLMLYGVYCRYFGFSQPWLTCTIWALAAFRILLCLFPQNHWLSGDSGRWGIYRNIPFALLGLVLAALFATNMTVSGPFQLMSIAIILSFGFYLPVVLLSKKHPKIGMLMLPKTCTYIWMLTMGLAL
ncbi:MAG: hypothetical protein LBN34_05380 [Clostridiales Family XIII bacterium]|nr:hypothetical protein [Clostridiales Family XIII bacterium]